jgi:hypothetical protein
VAKETNLIRLKPIRKPFTYGTPETIIENIPDGGHYTRTIIIYKKIYLPIGSSCNVCVVKNSLRATISRFNLDGLEVKFLQKVFAIRL